MDTGFQHDICPIMSIGKKEPVYCTDSCAWFDTDVLGCAIAQIDGNLKWLKDIVEK